MVEAAPEQMRETPYQGLAATYPAAIARWREGLERVIGELLVLPSSNLLSLVPVKNLQIYQAK